MHSSQFNPTAKIDCGVGSAHINAAPYLKDKRNYVLSKSRLILEFSTKKIICAPLLMNPMIKMTATPPRCGLHLLLQHVLVACTLYHL